MNEYARRHVFLWLSVTMAAFVTLLFSSAGEAQPAGGSFPEVCDAATYGQKTIEYDELVAISEVHREWLEDIPSTPHFLREINLRDWLRDHPEVADDSRRARLCGVVLKGRSEDDRDASHKCTSAGAYSSYIELTGADLRYVTFVGGHANIRLRFADLRHASFSEADLRGADFIFADLTGASFHGVELYQAEFGDSILKDAWFIDSKLDCAWFSPSNVDGITMLGVTGLANLRYETAPGLVKLRDAFRQGGFRRSEREVTSALRKFEIALEAPFDRFVQRYLAGGLLTDFGASPWRSLAVLLAMIPVFALVYAFALLVPTRGRIAMDIPPEGPTRVVYHLSANFSLRALEAYDDRLAIRLARAVFVSFAFSVLTAFRIGWKAFNISTWLYDALPRDIRLRGEGWVRSVAGVQSLASLYLFVLWALTYFGTPFA